jgi:hypothetical protein
MLFEEARRIDPTFARAYAGLAYAHLNHTLDGGMWSLREPDEHRRTAMQVCNLPKLAALPLCGRPLELEVGPTSTAKPLPRKW